MMREGAAIIALPVHVGAQHQQGTMQDPGSGMTHDMWMAELGAGWRPLGMGQAFPIVTFGAPGADGSPSNETAFYLTQPALMANVESPGSRFSLQG